MNRAEKLTTILRRINQGEDPEQVKLENSLLLSEVTGSDIANAESKLLDCGYTVGDLYKLVPFYKSNGIICDHVSQMREKLADDHIIKRMLAEHDLMLCALSDIEDLTQQILHMTELSDVSSEYRQLAARVGFIFSCRDHIALENEVIYPEVKMHSMLLCAQLRGEHLYMRIACNDLYNLVDQFDKFGMTEFQVRLHTIVDYLCPIFREHIFQENTIFYPLALDCITEEKQWQRIKAVADEAGYSIF